jgi:hypothetical protein
MAIPRERERQLLVSLTGFPPSGVLVIGGYAVSARSIPRYSHDIDLVLDDPAVDHARTFLEQRGFRKTRDRSGFEGNYGGSWERWQRSEGGPTVDLLPRSVQDRTFRFPLPFARASRGAQVMALRGLQSGEVLLPVASVEVLLFLKFQPLRDRDIGDIACLASSGYESRVLGALARSLAAARPAAYRQRVAALEARLLADRDVGAQFLGSRIPGPRSGRDSALSAVGRLVADLKRWAPPR